MMLRNICSLVALLVLAACGSIERPNAQARWINNGLLPDGSRALQLRGYHLQTDYDESGALKPGAKPQVQNFETCESLLITLNGAVTFDPKGQTEVKRYLREASERMKALKDACGVKCLGL